MTLTEGSLCSGYNGLGLAVAEVLGTELAWYSEIDDAPAAVMAHHYPGVPNLGDLTTVDWTAVPPVDVLTAGYPCQPFSHAGQRKGTNDDRHLWPYIADAIRLLRPRLVVLENVAGHLSLGFDAVLGDLASIGFDAEWRVVRASDVGACHQRARLFIVARDAQRPRADAHAPPGGSWGAVGESSGGAAADAGGVSVGRDAGATPRAQEHTGRRQSHEGNGTVAVREDAADADKLGPRWLVESRVGEEVGAPRNELARGDSACAWGDYAAAIRRHAAVLGRPAPRPTGARGRLAPEFVEWMMMLSAGWVTGVLPNRTQALKCLGNGVVPAQAAYALRVLLMRVPVPT